MRSTNPSVHPMPALDRFYRWDRWIYGAMAATMGALAIANLVAGDLARVVTDLPFALVWLFFIPIRRRWVASGFTQGRWAAIESAREARERGLGLSEWVISEMERELGGDLLAGPAHDDG